MLLRGPALPASPQAVLRVLKEGGYELEEVVTRPHPPKVQRFERSRPNELWQTDIFTFTLKRQNRRVYLVVFLDDHSRFIVGWGLQASPSAAWVIDVFRCAVASFGPPDEVLTDNGPQYVTWRGKSAFAKELERRRVRHVVARPRRPQTLGKVERFWGSLWRECVETALFADIADATVRVGHYVDHHNLQRPHQGIGGLVPADRYFGAESEVRRALEERTADNAIDLAQDGVPKEPFYLTGKVGGKGFSVHADGERVILLPEEGGRREIELVGPAGRKGPDDGIRDATTEEKETSNAELDGPEGEGTEAFPGEDRRNEEDEGGQPALVEHP
jgi:transposase InsO family protein